ncbi:NACHT domain-containing protein [Acidovorax facilis]|uniref:NACHT domain-containing protein n=1 Tax=Acidovorax facilis TaxID=12917 RepID=UPI003D64BF58
METYQGLISRLGQHLTEIELNIDLPLADTANKYRLTAEAICKSIIVGHGAQPQGLLEKLIADALKWVEADENNRDAGMFKAEIRYLQSIGNMYSHDGAESNLTENEDQTKAFDALVKVVRIAFFGQGDLDPPSLPKSMEERIPARMLGRVKFENPRAEEVVRLCFPKNRVETKFRKSDHDNRLVYDYVVADLGGGLSKGMIFMRSRTAIEKMLTDFLASVSTSFPDALEIITPRAYRSDGGEIDRRKSILDIIKDLSFDSRGRKVQVKYFDDFVWESCLPEEARTRGAPIKKTSHFIEQTLESIENLGRPSVVHSNASEYIAKILRGAHNYNPVHVVIGPAGIGKTTFCDDIATYINAQERKRVILLSATDFRETSNSIAIESVSDLYKVAAANGLMDEANSIESHNFEINLACGNFVLLIDGFDELESHLGASLNFEKFMRSLADLEECFRKVLVILTVRDYDIERFKHFSQTSICRLRGFSNQDTERYIGARLPKERIAEARALLKAFNEDGEPEKATTIPLYVSLICDYLIEYQSTSGTSYNKTPDSAKFFSSGQPLDALVKKIVDREIAKQSLGKIGPDDFFDILIEIIRAPQHTVTKAALLEYISACDSDAHTFNSDNFLRNPFLIWEKETILFRYDSLTYFFKSRLLARKIKEGQFSESPSIEFMAEFYHGEGPLYDEITTILPASEYANHPNTLKWFSSLYKSSEKEIDAKIPWRKAISAFFYWALSGDTDKVERSRSLVKYFNGNSWNFLSIYGRFYPLDLNNITVKDGYIDNYTNLRNCDYESENPVFYSTQVNFDDRSLPEKLERSLFAADCIFSPNLAMSFQAKEMADESGHEIIRDNIYKILKVGFRSNHFSWKSKDVYKNVTVIGKFSLDAYLNFLTTQGVLTIEYSRAGAEPGYLVSDAWYSDARKLVEAKDQTRRMMEFITHLQKAIQ